LPQDCMFAASVSVRCQLGRVASGSSQQSSIRQQLAVGRSQLT
jgi:hypothetical protein